MEFNDGKTRRIGIDLPPPPWIPDINPPGVDLAEANRNNPDYDLRKKPAATKLHRTFPEGKQKPKREVIHLPLDQLIVYPSVLGRWCISSLEHGVVKRIRLTLHQHPVFAPKGDVVLSETIVRMPVYEVYVQQMWMIRSFLSAEEQMERPYEYTVSGACEAADGTVFRDTKTRHLARWPRPSVGGHSSSSDQ